MAKKRKKHPRQQSLGKKSHLPARQAAQACKEEDCNILTAVLCTCCGDPICFRHRRADRYATFHDLCQTCVDEIELWRDGQGLRPDGTSFPHPMAHTWANPKSWGGVRTYKTVKIDPLATEYNTLDEVDGGPIYIRQDAFVELCGILANGPDTEIAGYAVVDEETNTIVWVHRAQATAETAATVESLDGQSTAAALMAGHPPPNLQWHTQPGMGVNPSSTDKKNEMQYVKDVMGTFPEGHTYFAIIDGLRWRAERLSWRDGEITLTSLNAMVVNDEGEELFPLNYPRPVATTYSYAYIVPTSKESVVDGLYDDADQPALLPAWAQPINAEKYEEVPDDAEYPTYYMGSWSDNPKDYSPLFDKLKVTQGDWESLESAIVSRFGSWMVYDQLIEDPTCWEEIL